MALSSALELEEIARGCQAVGVRTYGQYCPIARASELLAERWSFIILRNIVLIGCRTFNEIADGAPGLSRGLLSKRLRDLERAGVIEIRPKPDGPGSTFGMVGSSGSAAYADIDSGVAVAVMRNRIVGDFTAVKAIDAVVAAHHG